MTENSLGEERDALPITAYKDEIISTVANNQVTIITAETGAGKSTQVPQYLAEAGYTKIIVTQPRIVAARTLSRRVREEWAERHIEDSEPIIGYRTAHERNDLPGTTILYCTDGLQLVRELTGSGTREKQVLILDEVHEWNENMEVLIAWARKRCQEEPGFKIVIMSATIDTQPLLQYFNTSALISVPGRSYAVTKTESDNLLAEILTRMPQGHNMLVFLPGKAEIQAVSEALEPESARTSVPVLPLHSQMESDDQQRVFEHYPNGKVILATNIAQTSITIDDIDVVIDSGLERRSEVRSGVEGLFIAQISQADCLQRAGRAGRTKDGEYVLAAYDTLPSLPFNKRPAYGTPEILRKHIDRLTLRLANVGIDIETLAFFHEPSDNAIRRAKQTLTALGALDANGSVTAIGKAMERYPVESNYGRMLVESEPHEPIIREMLAVIIAIQEVGGIVKGGTRYTGWKRLTRQTQSDLLAQYDVYRLLHTVPEEEYEETGIIAKNVIKASEVIERLARDLQIEMPEAELLPAIDKPVEERLLRCIVAGQIDQIWSVDDLNQAVHIFTKDTRELSSSTVVKWPRLITGTPFDLEIPTHDGRLQTLNIVQGISVVKTEWLIELAPQLFMAKRGKMVYDPRTGGLVIRQQVKVGKMSFEGTGIPVVQATKQNQKFFQHSLAGWIHDVLEQKQRAMSQSHAKRIPPIPLSKIRAKVRNLAANAVSLDDLPSERKVQIMRLTELSTFHGEDFMQKVAYSFKHGRGGGRHHAHRGFRPGHKRRQKKGKW